MVIVRDSRLAFGLRDIRRIQEQNNTTLNQLGTLLLELSDGDEWVVGGDKSYIRIVGVLQLKYKERERRRKVSIERWL